MSAEGTEKAITKDFLEKQIKSLQQNIDRNIGAINLCSYFLEKEMYVQEAEELKVVSPEEKQA